MKLLGIIEEDFCQYHKPSLTLMMPFCSWKCGKELCQNSVLAQSRRIDVDIDELIQRYKKNKITKAIVFGGLEPFDSLEDIKSFIVAARAANIEDEIIIYTGYTEKEIFQDFITKEWLDNYGSIIVKFGRFIPNQKSHLDPLLLVNLASDNQYAKKFG